MNRRTSGEIVNATLLEVFLALTFLVISVAEMNRAGRLEAESRLSAVEQHAVAARDSLQHIVDSLQNGLRATEATRDSLLFRSSLPPMCRNEGHVEVLFDLSLLPDGRIGVIPNEGRFGFRTGVESELTPDAFRGAMDGVRAYSVEHGCRFRVQVHDQPATPKRAFKSAMAAILSVFYGVGQYSAR